jgi:hypothetical protein
MKTTIDIPEKILSEVLLYSKMKSKKDAIITAMEEYVQKKKMEKFASKLGTLENLISNSELQKLKRKANIYHNDSDFTSMHELLGK